MSKINMSVFANYCKSLEYHQRLELRKELEKETEYSQCAVWNWMNALRTPKKPVLKIIAGVVGINVEELFPEV